MRTTEFTGPLALRERFIAKDQINASIPESSLPPYLEMFLAHLRLLIGVPFENLVPDSRLLPDESIRFFYLDRSWTDRLVDGAIAVGKIGTREQAHHQAHAADVQSKLDLTERVVRILQRGPSPQDVSSDAPGNVITGFLLRSAAVAGWPSMDVRAFSQIVPASQGNVDDPASAAWAENATKVQLTTLRLELLSPSVLLALFDGIPELVWCEEPHHQITFGVTTLNGAFYLDRHKASGETESPEQLVPVPVRAANQRVIAVQELRKRLYQLNDPNLVPQTGSAGFAIEFLIYPWRQRFQDGGFDRHKNSGVFISKYAVAKVIADPNLSETVKELV